MFLKLICSISNPKTIEITENNNNNLNNEKKIIKNYENLIDENSKYNDLNYGKVIF